MTAFATGASASFTVTEKLQVAVPSELAALQVTAFTPFGKLKGEVMVVPFPDEKKAAPSLARVTAGRNPDRVYGRTPV